MKQEDMLIVQQKMIAPKIFELVLQGELVNEMSTPGQFIHCKPSRTDLLLRRPISLSSIDRENKRCTIIYRVEGDGTKNMSEMVSGETMDVLGPLGSGFPVEEITSNEVVVIVGGGIGIPPLYEVARQAHERGAKVISFLGYASKKVVYYVDEFKKLGDVIVSTDDGSFGEKGHVGMSLDKHLPQIKADAVYACGAKGMLAKVDDVFHDHPRAYISMEERMACGVGACYACVCHVKDEKDQSLSMKKVCDEGPVFKTGEVVL
ncbi:dihydroorotate dehydrogenase electron transfer subunit [Vagococcus elongatus]|uniref:dihydroorotate dehydrogenase electron transfer subunit n=1 Tax=Vagococcus elongatus TaxID=180344 RepID=UPI001FE33125|nr:dihydroorotate dehydrogenase electron transfer subunit [Vagococcus elongatus]